MKQLDANAGNDIHGGYMIEHIDDGNYSKAYVSNDVDVASFLQNIIDATSKTHGANPMETRGKNNPLPPGILPKSRKETPAPAPGPVKTPTPRPETLPNKESVRPNPSTSKNQVDQRDLFPPRSTNKGKSTWETPKEVEEVKDQIMDTEIRTKVSQLLAISPNLRRMLNEVTRNPRATDSTQPANLSGTVDDTYEAFYAKNSSNLDPETIVGRDSCALAEVEVLVNGELQETALIDDGCSVVIIHQELWRDLQIAKNPNEALRLESVDQVVSTTQGRIRNLPVTIAGMTFYVQAQVVTKAPARMILGKAFFALANCQTTTFPDGFTTIHLTDPNNKDHSEVQPCKTRGIKGNRQANYFGMIMDETDIENDEGDSIDEFSFPSFC
jgi:hypothetical protein